MARHLLSDLRVQKAKPKAKPYRLADGDGLHLYVSPTGVKSWQYRYRLDGKRQTLTIGKTTKVSLAGARAEAQRAREKVCAGVHLTVDKRLAKAKRRAAADNTFASVAKDWLGSEARRAKWSPSYRLEVKASLHNHLSELDTLPMAEITAPIAAPVLRKVENVAPMMIEKVRRRLRSIFDFAVEQGVLMGNPLPAPRRTKRDRKHFPAVTSLAGLGEILRAGRASDPCKGIQRAHLLLAFTALRVSEVVGAKWSEFALDGVALPVDAHHSKHDAAAGNWTVPRERMKRKDEERGPHIIPLPAVLLAALREWRKVDGQDAIYVSPAPRDERRPITIEAVEKHYRNALGLGGRHSPHSWRSAFSTVAREAGKDSDAVEAQLDHVVGTKVASAYDRATRLELRRELMTWYEVTLVAARDGAKVLSLRHSS